MIPIGSITAGQVQIAGVQRALPPPESPVTVTSVQNPAGSAIATGNSGGGDVVYVIGTQFVGGTPAVTFGGEAATSISIIDATTIQCTTPAVAASTVDVVVTLQGGSSGTGSNIFTYEDLSVTAVSPTTGGTAGGTAITLTGTGFQTGMGVTVGGAAATSVVRANPNTITCLTPSGSAGAQDIVVDSSATLAASFTYAAPTAFTEEPAGATILHSGWVMDFDNTVMQDQRSVPGGDGILHPETEAQPISRIGFCGGATNLCYDPTPGCSTASGQSGPVNGNTVGRCEISETTIGPGTTTGWNKGVKKLLSTNNGASGYNSIFLPPANPSQVTNYTYFETFYFKLSSGFRIAADVHQFKLLSHVGPYNGYWTLCVSVDPNNSGVNPSNGKRELAPFFAESYISNNTGFSPNTITTIGISVPLSDDTWYRLSWILYMATRTVEVYVDGTLVVTQSNIGPWPTQGSGSTDYATYIGEHSWVFYMGGGRSYEAVPTQYIYVDGHYASWKASA